jgi:hypothetical protein
LLRVAGGQVLDLDVRGRRPGQARTIVAFDQPAFEDEAGNLLHSLELTTGRNPYRLRSFQAGVCRAPRGCRYVVVNAGLATRPAQIGGAAGTLIIESAQ